MRLLDRRSWRPSGRQLIRPLVVLGILVGASVAWHMGRPRLVRELAKDGIRCPARELFLVSALRERYPELFDTRSAPWWDIPQLWDGPSGMGVIIRVEPSAQMKINVPDGSRRTCWSFFDAELNLVGRILTQSGPVAQLVGDHDGDGSVEVPLHWSGYIGGYSGRYLESLTIVRLNGQRGEIVGIVVPDPTRGHSFLGSAGTQWRPQGAGGAPELLSIATQWKPPGNGPPCTTPADPVAIFEWDRPGGILRPTMLPDDRSILVWTPADGKAYPFSPDEPVEDVARKLLPIPDGFGAAATKPATTTRAGGQIGG